jgi:seryl-tRNA synthetase
VKAIKKSFNRFRGFGYGTIAALLLVVVGYIYQTQNLIGQARIDAGNAKSAVKLQQVEVEKDYKKTELELSGLEKKRDELVGLIGEFEKKLYDAETGLKDSYNTIVSQTTDIRSQLDAITIFKNNHIKELEKIISELQDIINEIQAKKEGQAK